MNFFKLSTQTPLSTAVEPNAGNERVTVLLKNDDATLSMCSSDGETRTITKNGESATSLMPFFPGLSKFVNYLSNVRLTFTGCV